MRILLVAVILFSVQLACATHLKGGYIRIEKKTGLTFNIIITVFTNTVNTHVLFGGEDDILDFGDGTTMLIPEQQNQVLYPGFSIATFEVLHTYSAAGRYTVSYSEPNRNEHVLNIDESVSTRFYIESAFTCDAFFNYASPDFLVEPSFNAAAGSDFSSAVGAVDPNDYTLTYAAVAAKNTINYRLPQSFSLNPQNGLMTWDTRFENAFTPGEYLFSIRIDQTTDGLNLGFMILDFSLLVFEDEAPPVIEQDISLDENQRIYVPLGSQRQWRVFFQDANDAEVALEVYSDIPEAVSYEMYDSVAPSGNQVAVAMISLTNEPGVERENPYVVVVRGTSSGEHELSSDLSYLFYTMDVQPVPPVVSNEKDNDNAYTLFPNPFSSGVELAAPHNKKVTVTIRKIDNSIVYEGEMSRGDVISFENIGAQVFVYQIFSDGKVINGRVVKK